MPERPSSALLAGFLALGVVMADPDPAHAVSSNSAFNDPFSTVRSRQTIIRDQVVDLIRRADANSTIRISMFQLWSATVANALTDAHESRAVRVQVVLDRVSATSPVADGTYDTLKASLGTNTSSSSFVTLCPTGRSCLGDPDKGSSVSHNKFFLLSSADAGTTRNVVLQTSSNLTPSSYDVYWNSATTVIGNGTLYNAYVEYFQKLKAKNWASWKYVRSTAGSQTAYFFPRAGSTNASDTIVGVLDNVDCTWSDATGSHRTALRLAMFTLTRQGVADKLASLRRAGCTVDIVYSNTDAGTWKALHFSGGPQMRCLEYDHDADSSTPEMVVHSKYMIINGWYAGRRDSIVFTGSQNYSTSGLRANDETVLKVNDDAAYLAYRDNFDAVRSAAVPGTADNVTKCKQ